MANRILQIRKNIFRETSLLDHSRKFSPVKISRYTVLMILVTFSKLTIVMKEKGGGGEQNLIDEFLIEPSLSGANNVTLTGKEQLATIALSYQKHCTNLPDCPTTSLSPTSKCITCTFLPF